MKPRLLFVVNNGSFFLSHRAHIARRAIAEGFDVAVASPLDEGTSGIEQLGAQHLPYPVPRGVGNVMREIQAFLALKAHFRTYRPEVVHLITAKPVIMGGVLARIRRIPILAAITGLGHVYVDQSMKSRLVRFFANIGYRAAIRHDRSVTVFQNQENADLFVKLRLVGRRRELIRGAGTDLDQFNPTASPKPGPPIVLLPARMLRTKGVFDFAAAARIVLKRGIEAKFVLAGAPDPGNPATVTEDELKTLTADGAVEWIGHQANIAETLAASSIVVLPTFYNEGLPKSLIDAAAAGRPIVTTDIAGCRDAIIEGETGLLVRPQDPGELADKITELLLDPAKRQAMGCAGRRLAESVFSDKLVASKHIQIYRQLGSGLVDHSQKMTVAASAMAEKNTCGHRS